MKSILIPSGGQGKDLRIYGYKMFDKVVICKGRLKGETGVIIGTSNLNMRFVIIVRRDNKKARDVTMGFKPCDLTKKGW